MECQQCGAALRPGARFCNVCGARQEITDEPQSATTGGAGSASDTSADADADAGSSAGRAKRPARIPRSEAGDAPRSRATAAPVMTDLPGTSGPGTAAVPDAEGDAVRVDQSERAIPPGEDAAGSEASDDAERLVDGGSPPKSALSDGEGNAHEAPRIQDTPSHLAAVSGSEAGPAANTVSGGASNPTERQDSGAEQPLAPRDWTEVETAEYTTVPAHARPQDWNGAVSGMPPLGELARTPGDTHAQNADGPVSASWPDGLPWPLPPSIIVGGRYRVEALISTLPQGQDAENVYRVHDLQGYERCWSCGAVHGASAAAETFCQECGADMLARDYLMSERLLTENEAATAPAVRDDQADEDAATDLDARMFAQGARAYRVTPLVVETPLFPQGARLTAAAATDTGTGRAGEANEDSLGLVVLSLAHESRSEPFALAVVADGLGGHANGQAASRLVVQRLTTRVLGNATLPFASEPRAATHDSFESTALAALRDGIEDGNTALCEQNAASGADMGSTLVALLVFGTTAYIANVGDSRAYVLDDSGLRRITTDHSLVEQLVAAGQITPEERYTHPQRNQILRSMGDERDMAPDIFQQQLRPGMCFLLCSDGLWEMVHDDEIERILREAPSPSRASDQLIQAANAAGGEDNITAVVVEVSA